MKNVNVHIILIIVRKNLNESFFLIKSYFYKKSNFFSRIRILKCIFWRQWGILHIFLPQTTNKCYVDINYINHESIYIKIQSKIYGGANVVNFRYNWNIGPYSAIDKHFRILTFTFFMNLFIFLYFLSAVKCVVIFNLQ